METQLLSFKKKPNPALKRIDFSFANSGQKRGKIYTSKKKSTGGAFDFLELIKAWEDIIGKNFAKKTIPLKHKGDTLTILTEHSSYSAQLKFLEQPLIEKISKRFESFQGKIKRINFQSNTTIFKEKIEALKKQNLSATKSVEDMPLHPQSPEYHALKQQADKSFQGIEDDDLKDSLNSLFIQMKTKKKD
jgi:hypothetical protein